MPSMLLCAKYPTEVKTAKIMGRANRHAVDSEDERWKWFSHSASMPTTFYEIISTLTRINFVGEH